MLNVFSMAKSSHIKNKNDINNAIHINPFRVKRSYNAMLEQDHSSPNTAFLPPKKLKQSEIKSTESLIKNNKPKIPEKILKEIERYNYQRHAYNIKIKPCLCDN